MKDLKSIRREYCRGGLRRENLSSDPIAMFEQWLQQALDADIADPTAMILATADSKGGVTQRIVLLKQFDSAGFVFYTNYASVKSQQIAQNSTVSLHFPWHTLERQVMVNGVAAKIPADESEAYFRSRPIESQLAAIASPQSTVISSRASLVDTYDTLKSRYHQQPIPMPDNWGGFRVKPSQMEFWQGGEHRLHDRFRFSLDKHGNWAVDRLAP